GRVGLWKPRCRKPLPVKGSTRYAVLERVGEPVHEDQEVLARADDVPLDLIVKVAEAITLDCRDPATTLGIQIGPINERDRIADLARVCRRDDLRTIARPFGRWSSGRSVGCEIDGRARHGCPPRMR